MCIRDRSIASDFDIPTILGAQIVGGCVAILVGIFIKKIRRFFPPLILSLIHISPLRPGSRSAQRG